MAWFIQVLELAEDGRGLGRYRLTETSDEDGGGPWGLCGCEGGHESREAAKACPEAQGRVRRMHGAGRRSEE